jgi:hypothetical protein
LFGGFDALGGRRHAEAPSQAGDRCDDGLGFRAVLQFLHKGPIDLDLVEGETPQIAQRGISGSKIVQHDVHAEAMDAAQGADRRLCVA